MYDVSVTIWQHKRGRKGTGQATARTNRHNGNVSLQIIEIDASD
jgi:hypothetical protein